MKLISLGLPMRNIRCIERMRKRTMRERFVQIENFEFKVADGLAPFRLPAPAPKFANGKLVAAKTLKAAVGVETR